MKIKQFFSKEYQKFKRKSWLSKSGDILTLVLIILIIIPASRKELMTYASKLKMVITSVEAKKEGESLDGKNSLLLEDPQGNQTHLDAHLDKPVFVNFWATWCPPCRAEMPAIEKLYQEYHEEVNFLLISDQPMAKQQAFLNKHNYELPSYQLLSRPRGAFSYSVLPTTMIISNNQKIILRKEGAMNWNSKKIRDIINGFKE